MTVLVDSTWIGMYIMAAHIVFLIFKSTQPKLTNILSSFRSTQPKWVDFPTQYTLNLMETTRLKYNLVFINLTWLLDVQMANIILKGSHSLKTLNIVFIAILLMQHKFCYMNLLNRSRRIWGEKNKLHPHVFYMQLSISHGNISFGLN